MKYFEDAYQYGGDFARANPRFNRSSYTLEDRLKELGLNDGLPPGFNRDRGTLPPGFLNDQRTAPYKPANKRENYDLDGVLDRIQKNQKVSHSYDFNIPANVPEDELVQGPTGIPNMQQLSPQQEHQLSSLVNSINSKIKPHQTTTRLGAAVDHVNYLAKYQQRHGTNKMSPADFYLGHDKIYYANDKILIK